MTLFRGRTGTQFSMDRDLWEVIFHASYDMAYALKQAEFIIDDQITDINIVAKGNLSYRQIGKATRSQGKAGRVLRKLFHPDILSSKPNLIKSTSGWMNTITDAEMESVCVALSAFADPPEPFLVTGEAIRYWYSEDNYSRLESSTLHKSCQKYEHKQHEQRFYARNPKVVGCVCLPDREGRLLARALVWKHKDGFLMDRCYGSDKSRKQLRSFARDRGWLVRANDKAEGGYILDENGNHLTLAIPLQQNYDYKPYLDTFQYQYKYDHKGLEYRYHNRNWTAQYHVLCNGELAAIPGWEDGHARIESIMAFFADLHEWPQDLLKTDPSWKLRDPETDWENERVAPVASERSDEPEPAEELTLAGNIQSLAEYLRHGVAPVVDFGAGAMNRIVPQWVQGNWVGLDPEPPVIPWQTNDYEYDADTAYDANNLPW
jgi:hypothetical protein